MPGASFLELRNLSKSFGGVHAVAGIDLDIAPGVVTAIIGPNGAGKTTLFNLVTGMITPTSGRVSFRGVDVTAESPAKRCQMGMARTFQTPMPFSSMTLEENVMVGHYYGSGRSHGDAAQAARERLDLIGLPVRLHHDLPGKLSTGGLKRLELARALATKPDLLLADEICGGLSAPELPGMVEALRNVTGLGITIILIEHVISVVMKVAERIVVLDRGRIIADGPPEEVVRLPQVQTAYLGVTKAEA